MGDLVHEWTPPGYPAHQPYYRLVEDCGIGESSVVHPLPSAHLSILPLKRIQVAYDTKRDDHEFTSYLWPDLWRETKKTKPPRETVSMGEPVVRLFCPCIGTCNTAIQSQWPYAARPQCYVHHNMCLPVPYWLSLDECFWGHSSQRRPREKDGRHASTGSPDSQRDQEHPCSVKFGQK